MVDGRVPQSLPPVPLLECCALDQHSWGRLCHLMSQHPLKHSRLWSSTDRSLGLTAVTPTFAAGKPLEHVPPGEGEGEGVQGEVPEAVPAWKLTPRPSLRRTAPPLAPVVY
jgi:hypothetical protein